MKFLAIFVALTSLFALSVGDADAQPSVARFLGDPNICFQVEYLDKSTGIWEQGTVHPSVDFRGDLYGTGSVDISVPNTTYIVPNPKYVRPPDRESRLRLVPCPPRDSYFGVSVSKASLALDSTERLNGTITGRFSDSKDPLALGLTAGVKFRPIGKVIVSPFASFDVLNRSVNHTFAAGRFLGTTTHWSLTAGARVGANTSHGIFIYGHGAFGWLNEGLNLNFGGSVSSRSATVAGFTLAGGAEFGPRAWRIRKRPMLIFAELDRASWADATFDNPSAAPLYNYTFGRHDTTIVVGLNMYAH